MSSKKIKKLLPLTLALTAILTSASFGQTPGVPAFSHKPGIYREAFELSITHADSDVEIRYTTDGSEPTAGSPVLNGTIAIADRTGAPNVFSDIRTTPARTAPGEAMYDILAWKAPYGNIAKGTAVRAAAFRGSRASVPISGSFFVFPENSPYRSLPLVSIIVDSLSFFGHEEGIYLPGANYANDSWTGNYYMTGDDWEREGSFEYFDQNGNTVISQNVGYRIHGGWTRRFPQKTLRVYARLAEYGTRSLDFGQHTLFHNRPEAVSFRRLLLRMGGNDCQRTLIRDASAQYMISHNGNLGTQAFRSVVVFLNGEFWGWHNIRERYDKHYLSRVYGVNSENIDLLDFYSGTNTGTVRIDISEGDSLAYDKMVTFARENDLANSAALDSMLKLIDIDSYLDFYAVQMFLGNTDGVYHNHKMWRERVPFKVDAPYGRDGRFRWLVVDLDQIMDIWGMGTSGSGGPTFRQIFTATNQGTGNEFFLNLMKSDYIKQSFINSFANLLNTAFHPERTPAVIDSIAATIRPVIDAQVKRWRNPDGALNDSTAAGWENQIVRLRTSYVNKAARYRDTVRTYFSAGADRNVTLKSDTAHGFIRINTMTVDSKLLRATSQAYPWSGRYFANVPITVRGVGKPYYRIEKWIVNGEEFTDSVLTVSLSSNEPYTIEAVFVYDESLIKIAGRNTSRNSAGLSVSHRVRSRSNVAFDITLPEAGSVQLRVYNLAGKEVARVANSRFNPGNHRLNWNTGKTAPGVYIYRLKAGNRTLNGRLRI